MTNSLLRSMAAAVAAVVVVSLASACGSAGKECCVNPEPPPPSVRSITVSPATVSLKIGESQTLTAQVSVVSGASTGVIWSSDTPDIVSVSSSGVVTGVSSGGGVVRATSTFNGNISGTSVVTVTPGATAPSSLSISPRQIQLNPGVSFTLTAAVGGSSEANSSVIWRSSTPSVASINTSGITSGVVTAITPGSTVITAQSTADTTIRDTVTVFVRQRLAASWSSKRLAGDLYDEVVSIAPFGSSSAFVVNVSGDVVRWDGSTWKTSARGTTYNTVFYAIHGSSSNNVIAVGANGVAIRWDGTVWTPLVTNSTRSLYGVWVESASSAWAVGASGTVQHWNGNIWTVENAGSNVSLNGVWSGDGVVYAVGASGEVRRRSGAVWSKVNIPSQDILYAVHGLNSNDVVIGGAFGTLLRWNGISWTSLSSPSIPGAFYTITGSSANGGRRYLAGDNGLTMLDELGRLSEVATPYAPRLYGVGMDASGSIWASGQRGLVMRSASQQWSTLNLAPDLLDVWTADASVAWAVGEFGSIYRWDGSSWTRQVTPTTATLDAVWSTPNRDAFAAGENGVVLRWNGVTWNQMNFPSTASIFSLWGTDGGNVYAVTAAGEIVHWDGLSWTVVATASGALWSVYGYSPTSVYASGENGIVLRLSGSSWVPMPVPAGGTMAGLWAYSSAGVYVVGANASGTGGVAYSWNGSTWNSINTGTSHVLTSLWGPGPFDLYATGDQGTMVHFDGSSIKEIATGTTDLLWSVSGAPDASGGAFAVGYNSTIVTGMKTETLARTVPVNMNMYKAVQLSMEPAPGTIADHRPLPDGVQRKQRKQQRN